jgi:hypothetical protein
MFRKTAIALALVALASCGPEEKPKSAHALALEAMSHADTKVAVAAFFDCLTNVAPKTPNGATALDLDRINRVIEACKSEEDAMMTQVTATWPKSSKRQSERRFDGLKEEAWKLIRENPFVPAAVSVPATP